jgi:hypothetical protein
MQKRYLGLVHHPIKNKRGDVVTTSVTNLDIHDIARSARTFGFDGYYIITPVKKQHELIQTILNHWEGDHGNEYNPDRQSALSFIRLANSVEEAQAEIEKETQNQPFTTVTGANFESYDGTEDDLAAKLKVDNKPLFLLFGTGWGLHASITDQADYKLEPLFGCATDGYNHLSVRSAVAIYCDRLGRSL